MVQFPTRTVVHECFFSTYHLWLAFSPTFTSLQVLSVFSHWGWSSQTIAHAVYYSSGFGHCWIPHCWSRELAAIDKLDLKKIIFVSFCLRAPGYGFSLWCGFGLLVGGAIQVPQLQLQKDSVSDKCCLSLLSHVVRLYRHYKYLYILTEVLSMFVHDREVRGWHWERTKSDRPVGLSDGRTQCRPCADCW